MWLESLQKQAVEFAGFESEEYRQAAFLYALKAIVSGKPDDWEKYEKERPRKTEALHSMCR